LLAIVTHRLRERRFLMSAKSLLAKGAAEIRLAMSELPRRRFLAWVVMPVAALGFTKNLVAAADVLSVRRVERVGPQAVPVDLQINGRSVQLALEPRETLLETLRDKLRLTGTKKGCDQGTCGACTVLVDGKRVNSCMTLAIMTQGKDVTTIEGLQTGEALHPMQAAWMSGNICRCGAYANIAAAIQSAAGGAA
jgi:xanthine dehydrogenase YagT iron-sulfur-binding subunit